MSKSLNISSEIIDNYLEYKNYASLAIYLKNSFKLERSEAGAPLQYDFSSDILEKLYKILSQIIKENINENHMEILKELFRSLRNYVINPKVQNYLVNSEVFLENVKEIVDSHCTAITDAVQFILQFLINLIISNKTAALKVYKVFNNQIFHLLKENLCVYESAALLYNISLYQELQLDFDQYVCLLEHYEISNDTEFLHFLIEKFITYSSFWNIYTKFDLNKRLIILAVIREQQIKGEELHLPQECLKTLASCFVSSGNVIFQTVASNESNLEPYEVSQLLQVISSLCSNETHLNSFQNDKDLLINSGVLLINIHRLGKETKNNFSSIQSLAEIREPDKHIAEHPAFGFKVDLVRIIGNLCWKNRIMQDLTREAELIPVILDCCNMDARNPFIIQWAILAVRNLCENNFENQKIIAEMHQGGTVSSSVLEEMGLTLHSDGDNSLKVIPLDTLRNQK